MIAKFIVICAVLFISSALAQTLLPAEDFGYVNVDDKNGGNEFWWFHGHQDATKRDNAPIVVFLQGGPGASSMFADYCEIGPIDACFDSVKPRQYAWNKLVNLLFVDNPVGTGFSFVTHDAGYARTEDQIASQLISVFTAVFNKYPSMQTLPFYIFAESYGGKMAVHTGVTLLNAIAQGKIKCNFKGVGLGDSWISPLDHVSSYGTFLEAIGHLNPSERRQADYYAAQIAQALQNKKYSTATSLWGEQQGYITSRTANMNWYNFLLHQDYSMSNLTKYINSVVKSKYKLTRDWQMSSGQVFSHLKEDFMQPAIDQVDTLLQYGYSVLVYSGQLDVIVDSMSTNAWIQKLKWSGLAGFNHTDKQVLRGNSGQVSTLGPVVQGEEVKLYYPGPSAGRIGDPSIIGRTNYAFIQKYKNLSLVTVLYAGHMVPQDNSVMAFNMIQHCVLNQQ